MGEDGIRNFMVGDIDDEGYFKAYLSQEQYQQLQSRKAWFEILIPDTNASVEGLRVVRMETVFAIDLLATDKTKAGVAKIPKPRREPDSLVGKPLLEFNGIKVGYSSEQAKDRMMLVCFWDMEQRPSRRCILELNKQAEELKQKGIAVITVQASEIDEDALNDWLEKNDISFPVGMIQSDEEKVRFAWGVRALPWLILADSKHVVRVEGFTMPELGAKIEEILR